MLHELDNVGPEALSNKIDGIFPVSGGRLAAALYAISYDGAGPSAKSVIWSRALTADVLAKNLWAAAGSVDTDLSFLSFLKVYRTDVTHRRMTSRRVVEPFDVIKDVGPRLLPGPVHLPGSSLGLQ